MTPKELSQQEILNIINVTAGDLKLAIRDVFLKKVPHPCAYSQVNEIIFNSLSSAIINIIFDINDGARQQSGEDFNDAHNILFFIETLQKLYPMFLKQKQVDDNKKVH